MQKPLALSQHSLPRPEHRAGESREPPQLQFQLCLPRLRQRGGSCGPGPRLAHTRCLISPLWPGIRPPPASLPGLSAAPMGEGRVQGPTCSTFSILELYYIKSLLLIWFFTAGTLIAFFHSFLPILEAGVSKSRPFRARESRGCSHSWNPAPKCQLQLHICLTVCPCRHCNPRKPQTTNQV